MKVATKNKLLALALIGLAVVGVRYLKVPVDHVRAFFSPPRLTVEALLKSSRLPLPVLPIVDEADPYKPFELNGHAFKASAPSIVEAAPNEPQESSVVRRVVKVQRVAAKHVTEKVRHASDAKRHVRPVASTSLRHKKTQQTTTAALTPG